MIYAMPNCGRHSGDLSWDDPTQHSTTLFFSAYTDAKLLLQTHVCLWEIFSRIFLHASGPTLMARGNCGAKAPPPPRAQPKSQFEFVPRDTEEFRSNQNLNSNLYREIPKNLSFSILISWMPAPDLRINGESLKTLDWFKLLSLLEWILLLLLLVKEIM